MQMTFIDIIGHMVLYKLVMVGKIIIVYLRKLCEIYREQDFKERERGRKTWGSNLNPQ